MRDVTVKGIVTREVRMVRIALVAWLATLAFGNLAYGQKVLAADDDAKVGPPSQRYRFSHTAEGVLRLDGQTGQVTLCRPLGGAWVCNPAPEETDALRVELKRKDDEVQKLAADVAQLKDALAKAQGAAAGRQSAQDALQADVARLKDALAARKDEIAGLAAQLEASNADLKKRIAGTGAQPDVDAALARARDDNEALGRELAATREQVAALQKQVEESARQSITQEERQGLVSRIALLEQDNSGLKGALARLEADNAVLKKQLADDGARRELDAAVAQARQDSDALKRELAATREQVAALQKQVAAQGDQSARDAEIARLKSENAALNDRIAGLQIDTAAMKNEIAALKPPPAPTPPAEVPPDSKDKLKLPTREDLERARAALNEAWRRVMDMIGQLQKDMMGGRDDPPVRL